MTYRCGSETSRTLQGRVVNLVDPAGIMIKRIETLRTHAWEVELASRGIKSATLNATSIQLEATCANLTILDEATQLFDSDVASMTDSRTKDTAGTIELDGWSQKALITGIEPSYDPPGPAKYTLTATLLDGVWHKTGETQQFWPNSLQPGLDLDYPHDFPHDYLPTARTATATNTAVSAMPFTMTIYGPVNNPSITMAGNRYELHMNIPSGSYVTINSVPGQRTITMTAENGDTTNVFSKGERGNGQDSGSYIFQPIPPGEHQVQWSDFGFSLTIIHERSSPAWLIS